MQGAALDEILRQYIDAEWKTDWEKAREKHGEEACKSDMDRTDAQRRADATERIFNDAASNSESAVPPEFVHNIHWDHNTYQEMLNRIDRNTAQPLDVDTYRCETGDGVTVDPYEAAINSLFHQVRRVVVDAAGTVIDRGRARLFTGSSREAVKMVSKRCVWQGCWIRASQCETDHLQEHGEGGRTNPGNGAPLCGKHYRWKQRGFRIWRDPDGTWHTHRPDGTEIP